VSGPDAAHAFQGVVASFARDREVAPPSGGRSFGGNGLKVSGKLFALISSRGQFVVKLPKSRVEELVRSGAGEYFDPGHGRLMREWVAMHGRPERWLELAREARAYVGGSAKR
jgi:hypothetical protein